jgi:predicted secreted hydrolase
MAVLMLDDRTLAYVQQGPAEFSFTTLEQGALTFQLLAPMQRWRLQAQADFTVVAPGQELLSAVVAEQGATAHVTFDLSFNAKMPPYLYPDHALDFSGSGQRHFEQAGEVRGSVEVDNEQVPVIGMGVRDHSWGVRDWSRPDEWYWINLIDKREPFFVSAIYGSLQDATSMGGFVWQDGLLRPVQGLDIEAHHADDLQLLSGRVHLATEDGQLEATLIPRRSAHILLAQRDRWQTRTSATTVIYRCQDRRTGRGWIEHGRREPV